MRSFLINLDNCGVILVWISNCRRRRNLCRWGWCRCILWVILFRRRMNIRNYLYIFIAFYSILRFFVRYLIFLLNKFNNIIYRFLLIFLLSVSVLRQAFTRRRRISLALTNKLGLSSTRVGAAKNSSSLLIGYFRIHRVLEIA